MSIWRVRGSGQLNGSLNIQGSKNSVLPIMSAAILTTGEVRLTNCPVLRDVRATINILEHLGCDVTQEDDAILISSNKLCRCHIPHELMREMRSSVTFLGAMLVRCGEAVLSMPGGCDLGSRPIDIHLDALSALGADIREHGGNIYCKADNLIGTRLNLSFPSVGATENAMLAACGASGETIITNAAMEPEIVDLQDFLVALGADISGAGTPTITIRGMKLSGASVSHKIIPDRIVAATLMCTVAATGGEISLCDINPKHFETVTSVLEHMGCEIAPQSGGITLSSRAALKAHRPIVTRPYPGFPTDAQPLVMAASLRAKGTSVIVENIFENRFRQVSELRRLGADISVEGKVAMVSGCNNLVGAPVSATDLRGGAALIIAALTAHGETLITDEGHIDRGYENLDKQLKLLGADIEKFIDSDPD
jgi:UDP-N-acetylglucosamine 1-carboxyvinyltransferase